MTNKWLLNRNLSLLWLSQIINGFGNKLSIFALPLVAIYVYNTNALQTSIITTLSFLPYLLFSPFIGAFVDRYNKRKITIISNLICIVLSLMQLLPLTLFYISLLLSLLT